MATKIITCTYASEYQDKKYGKQRRVGNWAPKQNGHRYTVCTKIVASSSGK